MSNLLKGEITNGVAELNFEDRVDNEFPTTVFLNGVVDKTFFGEEYPANEVINEIDHGNVGDKVTIVIGNKVKTLNKIHSEPLFSSDITLPVGIPDSVTTISDYAFYNCPFFTGSLTIPDSVTTIGDLAFTNCSGFTGSLTIPDSVTSIGEGAFNGCSGFTGDLILPEGLESISNFCFSSCNNFTGSLTIPDSVKTIGLYAFYQCRNFTGSLIIPEGVTTIGESAFSGSWGFTGDLNIPSSVTLIAVFAFSSCIRIGSITLPSTGSLELGLAAFSNCSSATGAVSLTGAISKIGREAFNSTSITSFNIDSNFDISAVLGIGSLAEVTTCTSINVDASNTTLKSINGVLFSADESILIRYPEGKTDTSYTIPNTVTTLDNRSFDVKIGGLQSLTNITLPTNLNTIDDYAFSNSGITANNLVIPNAVTTIGLGVFSNCDNLTGLITIPNSVTSIGNSAFSGLSNISGINCYIDKSIIDAAGANLYLFAGSSTWPTVFTIHARSSDSSWTAGTNQTIGGNTGITVIKDLPG